MTRPEEDVAERLERALHAGLDDVPVDVGRLAARTRTGVRRAAVRRTVATAAAAVAVVAVPVAVAAGPFTGALGTPASETGSASPTPSASAPQDPSPSPSASDSGPAPSPSAATSEPDVVVSPEPTREEMFFSGDYGGIPQVQGQTCNRPQVFPRPVAGSARSWADAKDYEALSVDVNVTGWAPGSGADRFAEVVADSSEVCAFDRAFDPAPTTGMSAGDERFAARMPGNRMTNGWASVRVGDLLVSVSVYDQDGAKPAVRLARELADLVASRVSASGLDAVARAGGAG